MRSSLIPWLAVSLAFTACDCSTTPPSTTCSFDSDCNVGEQCVDEACVGEGDDAGQRDGALPDASIDASVDTFEPECTTNDDCDESTCVSGMCCEAADVCGTACCGSDQACLANACVTPGATCRLDTDCGDNEYCEPALGDPVEPTPACPTPVATGRCVGLPPLCPPGVSDDGCVRECMVVPERMPIEVETQWVWNQDTATEETNKVDVWMTPVVGRVFDTNCDGETNTLDSPTIVVISDNLQRNGRLGRNCNSGDETGCRRGVLRFINGSSGLELHSLSAVDDASRGFAGISPVIGDFDHDGEGEVVAVTGERRLALIDSDGTVMAVSEMQTEEASTSFGWGGGLAAGDMEGDGTIEVVYGRSVFEVAPDGSSIALKFIGTAGRGGGQNRALSYFADVNNDGDLELVASSTAYDADGSILWQNTDFNGAASTAIADFDGDGSAEVVLVNGTVGILAATDGSTLVRSFRPSGTGTGGPPTVADFDGDGALEIGVAYQNRYVVMNVTYEGDAWAISELWATENHDLSSSVTGSTVFDFEGDGAAEVVYADECFLWIFDGATGDVRFAHPTSSFTGTEASIVADIDGDGRAEMLMVGPGTDPTAPGGWDCETARWLAPDGVRPGWTAPEGERVWRGLYAFKDPADRWVGTRPLWNQHSYYVTNVCDPGDDACTGDDAHASIPMSMRSNWTVPWLNNFRQNVQQDGLFDAPDAALFVRVSCEPSTQAIATVRNLGQAVLTDGVEVAFYINDVEVERQLTTAALFPGQAVELVLPLDAPTSGDVVRAEILNDPAAPSFVECFDDNNEDSAAYAGCGPI